MQPTHLDLFKQLSQANAEKILLAVIDGVGGLRHPDFDNLTELEYAARQGLVPNLTRFVRDARTSTGLMDTVARGITPGSGAGHLGLFGYDPLRCPVKRGAIEAAGTDDMPPSDVVARINFCRVDERNVVVDRRAGRLGGSPVRGRQLAEKLNGALSIEGVSVTVVPTTDHRGVLALRVEGGTLTLGDDVNDTDPGAEGKAIRECAPTTPGDESSQNTANVLNEISRQARDILSDEPDANMMSLRGIACAPTLPRFEEVYSVRAAAIALYPLYRGVASIVGMTVLRGDEATLKGEVDLLERHHDEFDFFYLHFKKTDAMGEDGNFQGKVEALAEFDAEVPRLVDGDRFNVVAITGDHSTPAVLAHHSEHAVPLAIRASTMRGYERAEHFTEMSCLDGTLGRLRGIELMPLLLAKAGKLRKFD